VCQKRMAREKELRRERSASVTTGSGEAEAGRWKRGGGSGEAMRGGDSVMLASLV